MHPNTPTGGCTWKRTAEDLLQCMEMGAKSYRALSVSRLKEFQGTEANCSGTEACGQVQTSSLLNLQVGRSAPSGCADGRGAQRGCLPGPPTGCLGPASTPATLTGFISRATVDGLG